MLSGMPNGARQLIMNARAFTLAAVIATMHVNCLDAQTTTRGMTVTQALDTIARMLRDTPRQPQLLRQRWLLLMNAAASTSDTGARRRLLSDALAAGDFMVEVDPTQADSAFRSRQMVIAGKLKPATVPPQAANAPTGSAIVALLRTLRDDGSQRRLTPTRRSRDQTGARETGAL
jgi:hypothetical protein